MIRYFLIVCASIAIMFYLLISAIGRDGALMDNYWKARAEILRNL